MAMTKPGSISAPPEEGKRGPPKEAHMNEIIFEVCEDDDGGYTASALGCGIHTEAETVEELKLNVREAVECFFDKRLNKLDL